MADNELTLYRVPDETDNQSAPVTSNDVSSAIDEQLRNVDVPVVLKSNDIRSTNFVTGSTGWQVTAAGNAEFNAGTFRGALVANSIDIPDTTTANSFHTDNQGNSWWGATTFGAAIASISKAGAAVFTSLTIAGYALISKGTFGGNGSDADPAITSGTTTVSLGSASTFFKNYTTLSITGTGALAFSSPHANGTTIILKSQGAVTLTSSATRLIDTRAMGAAAPPADTNGAEPNFLVLATNSPKGLTAAGGVGGAAGKQYDMPNFYTTSAGILARRYVALICGASGAGGSSNSTQGGTGGAGGGALLIECAGALNFTGTIDVSGSAGGNGPDAIGTNQSGGGGGGGSAATCVILYNALTANSGTITDGGGNGGASGAGLGTAGALAAGGGGAGSIFAAGGAGGNDSAVGNGASVGAGGGGGGSRNGVGAGIAGGSGGSTSGGLVAFNTFFA